MCIRDSYITKPFNPLELNARVKSVLRRYTQLGAIAEKKDTVFQIGGLRVDDDRKEVTVDGEVVKLTPMEYRILLLLVQNPGKVFSIGQIYERIWKEAVSYTHLEDVVVGENCELGVGEDIPNKINPKVYSYGLVTIGENTVIPSNVKIGLNTAISGKTEESDYPDGILASGETLIKAGERV